MHISASSLLAVAGIIAYTAAPVAAQYLDSDEYVLGIRDAFPEHDMDFDDLLSLYARGGAQSHHSSTDAKQVAKVVTTGLANVNTPYPAVNLAAGLAGKGIEHYVKTSQPPNMVDGKLISPNAQLQQAYRAKFGSQPPKAPAPPHGPPRQGGSPRFFSKRAFDDLLEEDAIWWV